MQNNSSDTNLCHQNCRAFMHWAVVKAWLLGSSSQPVFGTWHLMSSPGAGSDSRKRWPSISSVSMCGEEKHYVQSCLIHQLWAGIFSCWTATSRKWLHHLYIECMVYGPLLASLLASVVYATLANYTGMALPTWVYSDVCSTILFASVVYAALANDF